MSITKGDWTVKLKSVTEKTLLCSDCTELEARTGPYEYAVDSHEQGGQWEIISVERRDTPQNGCVKICISLPTDTHAWAVTRAKELGFRNSFSAYLGKLVEDDRNRSKAA